MKIFFRLLLIIVFITSSGCHTYVPVDFKSSTVEHSLKVGDKIFIKTIRGEKINLIVEKIESDYLTGSHGELVKYSDIAVIKKSDKSTKKTLGLVAIIGGALIGLALYVNALVHMDGH